MNDEARTVDLEPMKPLAPGRRPGESIQAAIERIAASFPELAQEDEPTYLCHDCQDRRFVMVPCRDGRCLCARIPNYQPGGHLVARECLSCDAGIAVLAGRWFKFVYAQGRLGKPMFSQPRADRFEAFLQELNPGSRVRVDEAFNEIVRREKAERAARETAQ